MRGTGEDGGVMGGRGSKQGMMEGNRLRGRGWGIGMGNGMGWGVGGSGMVERGDDIGCAFIRSGR